MNSSGEFSLSLKALRLQLATLMDSVGGRDAQLLLDSLAELHPDHRQILLNLFINVVDRMKSAKLLELTQDSKFEEELTAGILADFESFIFDDKSEKSEEVIDFVSYRKNRLSNKETL